MEDQTYDTPQGTKSVTAGKYDVPDITDALGNTVVNFYFELGTGSMTLNQQIIWLTNHAQLLQQSRKKTKDTESYSTFVDRTLRVVQEDWQSNAVSKIPGWLLSHMMFEPHG